MEEMLAEAVNLMREHLQTGDWGRDPEVFLAQAEQALQSRGWVQNSIDGHWQ